MLSSCAASGAEHPGKGLGEAARSVAPSDTWPLLNLIFMISGAALGVLAIATREKRKERNPGRVLTHCDEKRYGAWRPNETSLDKYGRFNEEEYPANIYLTVIKLVAVCAATTGVIVWCVTQKIAGQMVMTDEYTLPQCLIAAAAGVSFILCVIGKRGPDKYEYKLK
jgi:hypothetical protein